MIPGPVDRTPTVGLDRPTSHELLPPKILLVRGRADLDVVEGIPDEFLGTNGTYDMSAEQRVAWEAEVRSLYDGMGRIVVTPTWAKLIDLRPTTPPERGRGARPATRSTPRLLTTLGPHIDADAWQGHYSE